jgi:hypothetical protein
MVETGAVGTKYAGVVHQDVDTAERVDRVLAGTPVNYECAYIP